MDNWRFYVAFAFILFFSYLSAHFALKTDRLPWYVSVLITMLSFLAAKAFIFLG